MSSFLIVLQAVLILLLVLIILLQKNAGNSLAGLSGGGNGVISSKAKGNLLTKLTMILAVSFMLNSLLLARAAVQSSKQAKGILEEVKKKDTKELEAPIAE